MQEEFHGIADNEGTTTAFKQLYGWGTLNTNVWLPSLCELVGYDPNQYYKPNGCYQSAMQGLNMSGKYYWTDAQGGNQFAYFKQYNTSGGGQKIWAACNQQATWVRSPDLGRTTTAWKTTNTQRLDWPSVTASHAVHPAVV